jgi:hypothetical protein
MKRSQLRAIIRYEIAMQWRRRSPLLIVLSLLAALSMSAVALGPLFTLSGGYAGRSFWEVTPARVIGSWFVVQLLLAIILPLTMAPVIPLDRQYGVREVMDSTPLGLGTYLTGKVLSVWVIVSISLAVVALVDGLVGRPIHGPFEAQNYLAVWLLGILPQALFISALSALLAGGQPTRKKAVAIGAVVAVFCYFGPTVSAQTTVMPLALLLPTAFLRQQSLLVSEILSIDLDSMNVNPSVPVPLMLAVGAAQIVLVGLVVRWWLSRPKRE